MKLKNRLVLIIFFALNLVAFNAVAQDTGAISGQIIDTNGSLPFVNISLKGTTLGTTSDLDGNFKLVSMPVGDQIIQISFIGYETYEQMVSVSKGIETKLGIIKLSESVASLDAVVLNSSILPSQRRAFSIQKNAASIQNVLAADGIGKLPDRNAAEAVQRVPGVTIERDQGEGRFAIVRGTPIEWSSNLLNGDRLPSADGFSGSRQVALDVIPTELIEYAIISKALTPDMEGDAIGGSINFKTRTAPNDFVLNASAAGGYNDQVQQASYNASVLVGDKVSEKFGYLFSAAIWDRPWASDNYELEYNFDLPGAQGFSANNLQLRDYEGNRKTIGLNAAAEYNFNDDHQLFIRGIYDVFLDDEFARQHNFNFPEGPDEDPNAGSAEITIRNGGFKTELYGGELGGEHMFNSKWAGDWKASFYETTFTLGNNSDLPGEFKGLQIAQFQQGGEFNNVSSDNYTYWDFDSPNGVGGSGDAFQPGFVGPLIPQALVLSNAGVFVANSDERDFVSQLNVKFEPNNKATYKAGTKYRNKKRNAINRQIFFIPVGFVDGQTPLPFYSDFEMEPYDLKGGFLEELNTPYSDILLSEMMTEGALDGLMRDIFVNNPDNYFSTDNFTGGSIPSEINGFVGKEDVTAFYAMGNWKLTEQLSVTAGARYEYTDVSLDGFELDEEQNLTSFDAGSSYGSLLPSVHLKFSPKDNLNLRAAFTRSLARPNFADINPNRIVTDTGSGITLISGGNPDLNPTYSNNFDLLGEYFFEDVGVISGGIFYKDLSNIIFQNLSQETINGETVRIQEPRNIADGYLFGFEAAFVKRFTFLPGFWDGFGVDANYTYTKSEVDVPSFDLVTGEASTTEQTLVNQPEHIYNASLFYEKYGFSARVAANFKGEYIDEYRVAAGPAHYRFYDKNLTVDFSASYSITDKIKVFAEVNNLTNEPLRYYHGQTNRPEQTEFYSIRGQLGIRAKLF